MTVAASAAVVFGKEVVDALRDRRTLAVVLLSGVLMGPLVLIALSGLLASFEADGRREVYAIGIEHAPGLSNYLERQTYEVKAAPTDYETRLRAARLADPVLVVPEGFEIALLRGEAPTLEVIGDSANKQAESRITRLLNLLEGYSRERALLSLAYRGVSAEVLEPLQVQRIDLASTRSRATQLTGLLPFFVMIAVLYGALNAALDTTAGERERGSLEPLLMTPAERWALVLGKWAAVVCVAMLVAVLSCFSFIPSQLLQSDTLQALFQFGLREALLFIALLLPFAAALSALLMAAAIRCRSVKEAQANSNIVILLVSLLPLVSVLNMGGEAVWHLWLPGLAQNTLMTRVLKGEAFGSLHLLIPLGVCVGLTLLCLAFVARRLKVGPEG